MEKNSRSDSHFLEKIDRYVAQEVIPAKYAKILAHFFTCLRETLLTHGIAIDTYAPLFDQYVDLIAEQFRNPFVFQPYHHQIRAPFDYYAFGMEFLRPLIDSERSTVKGLNYAQEIVSSMAKKENVILLANHQTEADPLAICLLLEKSLPQLASELICIAGERVTTDPLAVPFSMGLNLLCIHSKRYIDHPPELKRDKQLHNKRTMELMSYLLSEGGKCIYVAPSGGRDRPNAEGIIEVAPFDPQSIEMLNLMTKKASRPTHFYPLALATYDLLPPPETIQVELGETRSAKRGDIHLAFGPKIDMQHFPGSESSDKHLRRKMRAEYIWEQVKQDYDSIRK